MTTFTLTALDIPCASCLAEAGQRCQTRSGKSCAPHAPRLSWIEEQAEAFAKLQQVEAVAVVESVIPTQPLPPVKSVREKFTLSGEPLPISACMRRMGFELITEGNEIECTMQRGEFLSSFFYDRTAKTWSFARYKVTDETLNTRSVSEAGVLAALLKQCYRDNIELPNVREVAAHLGARLVAVATTEQLDTLRSALKQR